MELLQPILLFLLGFLLLIKGGDWFVDGATGIAHRFRLPELLIGATVVSIGTTLPEVMVSTLAAVEGNGGIAYGNAIGSIICNTSLIAALTMAIRPGKVDSRSLRLPVAFFLGAAAFYSVIAYAFGRFDRWAGIILLCAFVCYMALTIRQMKLHPDLTPVEDAGEKEEPAKERSMLMEIVLLVVGAACIAVGANLLVDNGTILAAAMGVPDAVIGLTMVALGTSLPELVTAITALAKGHSALSLGNIIGANLFNLVLVSGLAVTINPFQVPAERLVAGINSSLVIDIPVMFLVMLIMCVPALKNGKLRRWQGVTLLGIYAAFTIGQFLL